MQTYTSNRSFGEGGLQRGAATHNEGVLGVRGGRQRRTTAWEGGRLGLDRKGTQSKRKESIGERQRCYCVLTQRRPGKHSTSAAPPAADRTRGHRPPGSRERLLPAYTLTQSRRAERGWRGRTGRSGTVTPPASWACTSQRGSWVVG